LLQQGHRPIAAGNASQLSYFNEVFGNTLDTVHLEGYNVRYSKWNKIAQAGLLSQLPAIAKVIADEHRWLQQAAVELQLDGIISDNRYGLYHSRLPSVILTHQLLVKTGMSNIADRLIQKLHYKYLGQFGAVWVPDLQGLPNLGGSLSHPVRLPANLQYIGLLSGFAATETKEAGGDAVMILLSGPEPQRTELSALLWQQALQHQGNIIFVEGSENAAMPSSVPPHIRYYKRLAGDQLAVLLIEASLVICRSGYSTLMDLVALGKKAILVPTPGQTEQQYLGSNLYTEGVYYCTKQNGFSLERAVSEARSFPYKKINWANAYTVYEAVVSKWFDSL
jgi:hypothetical protein